MCWSSAQTVRFAPLPKLPGLRLLTRKNHPYRVKPVLAAVRVAVGWAAEPHNALAPIAAEAPLITACPASAMPGPRNTTPQLNPAPFAEMEDISSVPLPEQRGSTFVQDIDEGIPDISDVPTDVHEVEYLGDQGDFVGTQNIPTRQWPDAI